jgi:5-methyltetrahydrofolate--homocysteine methyltransferase
VAGGADAILIETMSDLQEVEAAVNAAKAEAPGLPILATMSFDTNLRTMMGIKPGQAVEAISAMGVSIIGANCGRGVDEMRTIAAEMVEARPAGVFLMTQSNAGLPKLVGDEFIYDGSPQVMADWAAEMRELGIDVIGACCGSTPEHIAAMRDIVLA